MSGRRLRGAGLGVIMLVGLGGCAALGADDDFPPAQPPAAAVRFKVTPPGEFPVDVFLSAWGGGYVIHAPGRAPGTARPSWPRGPTAAAGTSSPPASRPPSCSSRREAPGSFRLPATYPL